MIPDLAAIAASEYEGWVAWVVEDAATEPRPVFEAVPPQYGYIQAVEQPDTRPIARSVLEWKALPHDRILHVAIYAWRGLYSEQPIAVISREPEYEHLRFIQFKRRGLQVPSGSEPWRAGQQRTGVMSYTLGYWDRRRGVCELIECSATGRTRRTCPGHPCWPRPYGFGLAPSVVGLTAADVPERLIEEEQISGTR